MKTPCRAKKSNLIAVLNSVISETIWTLVASLTFFAFLTLASQISKTQIFDMLLIASSKLYHHRW
jgi:hypothetical protein